MFLCVLSFKNCDVTLSWYHILYYVLQQLHMYLTFYDQSALILLCYKRIEEDTVSFCDCIVICEKKMGQKGTTVIFLTIVMAQTLFLKIHIFTKLFPRKTRQKCTLKKKTNAVKNALLFCTSFTIPMQVKGRSICRPTCSLARFSFLYVCLGQ